MATVVTATPKIGQTRNCKKITKSIYDIRADFEKGILALLEVTKEYQIKKQFTKQKKWIEVSDKLIKRSEETFTFPLVKVTSDEIAEYRESNICCFVFKKNNQFFLAQVHKGLMLTVSNIGGFHMCSTCKRLSAASDKNGGCAKVRAMATGIERLKFIQEGIETFNCSINSNVQNMTDIFIVSKCDNYDSRVFN